MQAVSHYEKPLYFHAKPTLHLYQQNHKLSRTYNGRVSRSIHMEICTLFLKRKITTLHNGDSNTDTYINRHKIRKKNPTRTEVKIYIHQILVSPGNSQMVFFVIFHHFINPIYFSHTCKIHQHNSRINSWNSKKYPKEILNSFLEHLG